LRPRRTRLSRSPAELRARAAEFQQMAKEARPMQVVGALLRIADRYQALADERERMHEKEAEGASREV
jgi:hypothetical protein